MNVFWNNNNNNVLCRNKHWNIKFMTKSMKKSITTWIMFTEESVYSL